MENLSKSTRSEQGQRTKRNLINQAFYLFEKYGYDHVTIDQICKELGLTKGAFYYHFKSKAEILRRRFKVAEGDILEFYSSNLHLTPLEQLRAMIYWFIDYFNSENRLEELIVFTKVQVEHHYENFAFTSKFQPYVYERIIRKGQELGHFKKDKRPEELAGFIMTNMYGLLSEWSAYNGKFDFAGKFADFYEYYLKDLLLVKASEDKKSV